MKTRFNNVINNVKDTLGDFPFMLRIILCILLDIVVMTLVLVGTVTLGRYLLTILGSGLLGYLVTVPIVVMLVIITTITGIVVICKI